MALLDSVKTSLQITGTGFDEVINLKIDEAKEYLLSAGISQEVIESNKAVGLICSMVRDLWTLDSGVCKFSDYTIQRIIQLSKGV